MNDDRNLGATENRFALTLVICLLMAVGYLVLLRLGGPSDSTIEVRPNPVPQPVVAHEDDNQPRVLPVDGPEPASVRPPEIATRPETFHSDGDGDSASTPARPGLPAATTDSQRR